MSVSFLLDVFSGINNSYNQLSNPTLKNIYLWDGSKSDPPKTIKVPILSDTCHFPEAVPRKSSHIQCMGLKGSYFAAAHAEKDGRPGTMSFDILVPANAVNDSSLSELYKLLVASYRGDTSWAQTPCSSWSPNKLPLGGCVMLSVVVATTKPRDTDHIHYLVYAKAAVTELSDIQREGSFLKLSVTMNFFEDPTRTTLAPWTPA